ncbi:MAG: hypothetical protein ABR509_03295, partial [Candidatus Limnocylindria bacterium]
MLVILFTGLRRKVLGLRANAVDFATGRCRVRVKGGHERLRWIPKPARAAVAAVVAEENKTP